MIANSDVQWCLGELQDILEADRHHHGQDELFRLMMENPDLPVVPMVDGEIVGDDSGYWVGKWGHPSVDEFLLCERYDYMAFKSWDDVFDVLEKYLSDEDFEKLPEDESECRKVYESLPWTKAIIVYITTAD